MHPNWHPDIFRSATLPPFALLERVFRLSSFDKFPAVKDLNRLVPIADQSDISFVEQDTLPSDALYYELFIDQMRQVPTRKNSWHDLFNALIWRLFPRSKSLLNKLHVEQINAHGLHPRTRLRNHLTHFDECGVLLICRSESLTELLREHEWERAFFAHRASWGKDVVPLVFGHANLEMLLNPFIGLTGKWLALPADDQCPLHDSESLFDWADEALVSVISQQRVFDCAKPLYPLPLLGIPDWHSDNGQSAFYQNTNYFMPKRTRA